jgi:AcrR family transcriptional regulator
MTARVQDPDEAARSVRTERRVEQLLSAAARLMARDGSDAVSMQAVAAEAGVSVGLIYRYFAGKDEILLAVILEILDEFAARVPEAVDAAGDDPVHRLAAGFRTYCEVIDRHRNATVLTYRETRNLPTEGRERIKDLEIRTADPLRTVIRDGVASGVFAVDDPDLAAYDLILLAHAWALKHWYFERTLSLDDYVARQLALILRGILVPARRRKYAALLDH